MATDTLLDELATVACRGLPGPDGGVRPLLEKLFPTALGVPVPKIVQGHFPGFERVFQRYGGEMYACAKLPAEPKRARLVMQAFLDLYAYERGYQVLKACEGEYAALLGAFRDDLFPAVGAAQVDALLRKRRFVILQGPPGTGKSRLADELRRQSFGGRGMTVQFHPAFTYEDFVVGLAPDAAERTLRFDVRRGALLTAVEEARKGPFLLHIDEVNRADLGKVLGEAIYLFEPGEVGGPNARRVRLPHSVEMGGEATNELMLPETLFVLCTMNTADRSIASLDIAVRRRFAFVTMLPERNVVVANKIDLATRVFDLIADVFIEHAPGDALRTCCALADATPSPLPSRRSPPTSLRSFSTCRLACPRTMRSAVP